MKVTRINAFDHREFWVAVVKSGNDFKAAGYETPSGGGPRKLVADTEGSTQEEVEAEIKATLNELSEEFVGFGGAINLFLKAYPGGFESPQFIDEERTYKRGASDRIGSTLTRSFIEEAIKSDDLDEFAKRVVSGLQATNLVSPFEKMRFNDAMKKQAFRKRFAPVLRDLLHGDFDEAFGRYVAVLKEGDAPTWPLVTYFPFLFDPWRHMFMKPETMQLCAYRLGFELRYAIPPAVESYRSLLEFTDFVRDGIASLEPTDNMDIYSFTYVIGAPGYVRETVARRDEAE